MKKNLLIVVFFWFMFSEGYAQKPVTGGGITHYNIVFAPDLSNRLNSSLYPKPVSDVKIVSDVLARIWPDITKIRRSVQQMDRFSVDFINKGLIGLYKIDPAVLTIDISKFELNQAERIQYLTSASAKKLSTDIKTFSAEYARINRMASVSNHGADIWTYFNSGIDANIVLPSFKRSTRNNVYRNILVLFTDGYIEAGIFKKGFDLSKSKINDFRKAFNKAGGKDITAFLAANPKFKVNPVSNPYLKNLEVLVLEMYDRSLSASGSATVHPTDMEIMKVVWKDWLQNSGVKSFEMYPMASDPVTANKIIMNYLKK